MIKNFMQFIQLSESNGSAQKRYGCAMLHFEFPELKSIHEMILPEDLFPPDEARSYGLEDESHTTLLYGLHSDEIGDETVMSICNPGQIGQVLLHNVSTFDNEKFDVLKFDADNDHLHSINSELCKLPHTTDFPNYHPHSTIAYLKKGTAQKYADRLRGISYLVNPTKVVYSKPDDTTVERSII
jgi:hypothetical protein